LPGSGEPSFHGNLEGAGAHDCPLTPGATYYLNVVMAPPTALDGVTSSCDSGIPRCEINAQPKFN
jgi:hypothetical protein